MTFDQFKQEDGRYVDEQGLTYEDATAYLQGKVLGLCMCGRPETNLEFVRDALRHVGTQWDASEEVFDIYWKKFQSEEARLFGNERVAYFVYYMLDKLGLTEHGGSVPGWLSAEGSALLADLDEWVQIEGGQQ